MSVDEKFKKIFFELFSLKDIHTMQYALECEYGMNDDLAIKLETFLEEWKKYAKIEQIKNINLIKDSI